MSEQAPGSVMLVTPRWERDGGVGAHVEASARALADAGLRVDVVAAHVQEGEDVAGVTLHESPELFNASAPMEARLGAASGTRSEVFHLHQVDHPDLVEAMRRSAAVVISAHAYTACTSGVYYFRPGQECTRGHGPGCIPNLALRGCAHTRYPKTLPVKYRNTTRALAALRAADLAVAYSRAVDRHLAANGLTRRTIVPLFPTMSPRPGTGHAERRRVLFAGRITRAKGVDVLIAAAREVDAEFVICGDGRDLQEMRALAASLGVERRVSFRGWLEPDRLAQELADASVVAVPSLWPEPFGLVGIEALAAGRPVVASATGGIQDWLKDGVSGVGVPPADPARLAAALNEILADPERQRQMGLDGQAWVAARFSPERHVAALLEGYGVACATWRAAHA
jgi:glycosyltransferase involved in cell wall biosynthesis